MTIPAFGVALGLACACGSAKPPEPVTSGSAASGSSRTSELRVDADGVGPLRLKLPIDKATLETLVGRAYSVVESEDFFEGTPYAIFEVQQGAATVLRINPVAGKIDSILVLATLPSDDGIVVGMSFDEVNKKSHGTLSCQVEYHDDPMFANDITCGAGPLLVFSNTTSLGEGEDVPATEMVRSRLQAIVIR